MSISYGQATERLLSGNTLTWSSSGSARAGSITLSEPNQRRLLEFLLNAEPGAVSEGSDTLFDGLIRAWKNESADPIDPTSADSDHASQMRTGPWRLHRIETQNFGGLNTYNGPSFVLDIGGENWCLEGSNGSGKTLLASAIIWTLTGYRLLEHDGVVIESGERTPVYNDAGSKIGSWPSLATYPKDVDRLNDTVTVTTSLVFSNPAGDLAYAQRTLVSRPNADVEVVPNIDPRLTSAPHLIEAGLLMPARLSHLGFGTKSASLYDAMKALTGLDKLADIAMGAGAFSNKGRRFLKYARDCNIQQQETNFSRSLEKARELAEHAEAQIPEDLILGDAELLEILEKISKSASREAEGLLTFLRPSIAAQIELTTIDGRRTLARAVNTAHDIVGKNTTDVPLFAAWTALRKARSSPGFPSVPGSLVDLERRLSSAIEWHIKQTADAKLRLKAIASRYFLPQEDTSVNPTCPLCMQELTTEDQLELAAELAELRNDARAAERTIDDACSDIDRDLRCLLPENIAEHLDTLAHMEPATDYKSAVMARFVSAPPFSDVLVGVARSVTEKIDSQADSLPRFQYPAFEAPAGLEPAPVSTLRRLFHDVRRTITLVEWWHEHRKAFIDAWSAILGQANEQGRHPPDSVAGIVTRLGEATEKATPLDALASYLADAAESAKEWTAIHAEQKMREAIADTLDPLKDLKHLVDAETHRTIESLSDRVTSVLQEIRIKERLYFGNAELARRQVAVRGRFIPDYKIDANLVANASWLRAVLWAFIFAMRDEAIHESGTCEFPLMVLDDPQLTFDPKNKRKWAEKIVELSNLSASGKNGIQLFLATHERQFFDIVTGVCRCSGQKGLIARPHGEAGVTQILNGVKLDRLFSAVKESQCDEAGVNYVRGVRVYCEDLLRIMLRPESYELTTNTLGALTNLLEKYRRDHIAPYNRPAFKKMTDALKETHKAVAYMNATSHTDDDTIGFAQAEEVEKFWTRTLQRCFSDAFKVAADYDSYGGDSRLYSYPDAVVQFPERADNALARANLIKTGIVAAATSDGLVGDGTISIEEWERTETVNLHNHDAYLVTASTLEPVATVGDVVLVMNYREPGARNLVVAAHSDRLLARRLNLSDDHPGLAVLTGQSTNPYVLPSPIISPVDKLRMRRIVGTVFGAGSVSRTEDAGDVIPVGDPNAIVRMLEGSRLFQVTGRSMEPIALENQLVITRAKKLDEQALARLEGSLVIAVDEDGAKYFKRIRRRGDLIILESANSDMSTSSELLSLNGGQHPALAQLLAVVGILFEEP